MAESDRWNDRRYRSGERERSQRMRDLPDYGQADYETDYSRDHSYGRGREDHRRDEGRRDDNRYAPFGAAGPVEGRDGGYDDNGERYAGYRRNEYRGDDSRNDDRRGLSRYASSPERDRDDYRQFGQPHDYNAPYGRSYDDRSRGEDRARQAGREARSWWDRATDRIGAALSGDDRRDPASHRGRGPKGYRRSDDRIREDVNDRLADDPYLDASEIEVQVSDSEVTLTGSVPRRADKRRAEALAETISGVTHVQNNLRAQNNDRDDDDYRVDLARSGMWGAPF